MPTDPHEPIYTLEQIYERYGVKEGTVRNAIKKGYISAIEVHNSRSGYKYMVRKSIFLSWWKNPDMHKRGRRKPGPIIAEHYLRKEEPLVIKKDFTPVSDILKEGDNMTIGEIKDKLDKAIVEEVKEEKPMETIVDTTDLIVKPWEVGEGWMDVMDAVRESGYSSWTIHHAIKTGAIKAFNDAVCDGNGSKKGGKKYYFRREEFDAWIAGKKARNTVKEAKEVLKKNAIESDDISEAVELVRSVLDETCSKIRKDSYQSGYDDGYQAAKKYYEDKFKEIFG